MQQLANLDANVILVTFTSSTGFYRSYQVVILTLFVLETGPRIRVTKRL